MIVTLKRVLMGEEESSGVCGVGNENMKLKYI
jgi:hypothetical protein